MDKALLNTRSGPYLITDLRLVPGEGAMAVEDGAVAIEGERILDLGTTTDVRRRQPKLLEIDGRGHTAMPGLVNAHTHAAMAFFRGLGHGRQSMIETFLFPAEKALTPELLEPLAYSYLYDGLRSGVTCFGDHYYFVDGVARAAERLGVRAVVGETVADLGGAFPGVDGWHAWRKRLDAWPYSTRIRPAIAPHAADTVSEALLKELAHYAKAHDLPLHLHLSQTAGERERVAARCGLSPVALAHRAGVLGPKTLAVHLVSADADDLRILRDSGATAGLCPASQIIYENLAPIALMRQLQLPIALATDCAASNDGADLMAEMRLYALLAKDRGLAPADYAPPAVLEAASLAGARAFGLAPEIGSLRVGKAADIVFLEDDVGTEPAPAPDVNLIYTLSSRHVRHVMIAGEFVLFDRRLTRVDEADLKLAYKNAVAEIHRRLAL